MAEIPDEWNGPVALQTIDVDAEAECGGDYSELVEGLTLSGLEGEPFGCDCDCGPGTVACGGTARVRMSGPAPIQGASPCTMISGVGGPASLFTAHVSSTAPTNIAYGLEPYAGSGEHGVTVDQVEVGPALGQCTAMPTVEPTESSWAERTIACRADGVGDACGDSQVCVARPLSPFDQAVCVWQEGDVECPAVYPDKTILHREVDDNRGCSECTCGAPNADCEHTRVVANLETSQGGVTGDVFDAPNPYCEAHTNFPLVACPGGCNLSVTELVLNPGDLAFNTPLVPCPPQGGVPIGDIAPAQPVTYCCTEL